MPAEGKIIRVLQIRHVLREPDGYTELFRTAILRPYTQGRWLILMASLPTPVYAFIVS